MFQLAAYLDRIGVDSRSRVDLDTLTRIQLRHSCSIPFEHIDVLDGRGISLEVNDIAAKLVTARRGGYCFEQNGLLLAVLIEIGFVAKAIGARVRIQMPREAQARRTHMFVSVELDGEKWIVDAGFGGFSLTAPIRWELDIEQPTPHETRRVIFEEGRYFHQALIGDSWQDMCEFTGEEMPPVDQDLANWWTSTNPTSKFRNSLSVGMAVADGTRLAILNDRFTHRRGAEILEQRTIEDSVELREVLESRFRLQFGAPPSFGRWPFATG